MGRRLAAVLGARVPHELSRAVRPASTFLQEKLAATLAAPELGGYDDVMFLPEESLTTIVARVSSLLTSCTPADFVVLYYTGHTGILSPETTRDSASAGAGHDGLVDYHLVGTNLDERAAGFPVQAFAAPQHVGPSVLWIFDTTCHCNTRLQATRLPWLGQSRWEMLRSHLLLSGQLRTEFLGGATPGREILFDISPPIFVSPLTCGRLTRDLMDGLRTGAADLNGDGIIRTLDLAGFLNAQFYHASDVIPWEDRGFISVPPVAAEEAVDDTLVHGKRKRVLLIEDNEDNRTVYRTIIEHFGYEIIEASEGTTGLWMAHVHRPDLILLDISMPGLSGWEVCSTLKAHPATEKTPIIALTTHALAPDRARAYEVGFDSYLAKPCEPRRVVAEIARFIGVGR